MRWKWLIILGVVTFSFSNIFKNGYIADDHFQLENNPYIRSVKSFSPMWTHDQWELVYPEIGARGYWRPLYFATYLLDSALPFSPLKTHHFLDVLFYVGALLSIAKLLQTWTTRREIQFLGLLFFATWPLHTEVVTALAGRGYTMMAIAWIWGWLLTQRYLENPTLWKLTSIATLFLISILSIETGILFPLLILPLVFHRKRNGVFLISTIGIVTALYLGFRHFVIPIKTYAPSVVTLSTWFDSGAAAFRFATSLLYPFQFVLTETPPPIFSPILDNVLGLTIFGCWSAAALLIFRHPNQRVAQALWWTWVPLLLSIFPWPRGSLYQDRYLFVPSIGLAGIFSFTLERIIHSKRTLTFATLAVGLLAASFLFTRLNRNLDYKNDVTLWCTEAERYPLAFDAQKNCGISLNGVGRYSEALPHYEQALKLKLHPDVLLDYGYSLAQLGNCKAAIPIFESLVNAFPENWKAKQNLEACKQLK